MAVSASTQGKWIGIYRGDITLELRILAGSSIHGELGIKDLSTITATSFCCLPQRGQNELRVGGVEILAQYLDEGDQILLILAGVRSASTIFFTLPKKETRDLELRRARVIGSYVRQYLLGIGGVVVVLFACIPLDWFAIFIQPLRRFRRFAFGRVGGPRIRSFLVGGIDSASEFIAFTSWRQ